MNRRSFFKSAVASTAGVFTALVIGSSNIAKSVYKITVSGQIDGVPTKAVTYEIDVDMGGEEAWSQIKDNKS